MENSYQIKINALLERNKNLRNQIADLLKENESLRKMVYELDEVLRKQQNVASALEFVRSYAVMHPIGSNRHDGRKYFSTVIVDHKPPALEPVVLDDEATPSKRALEIKRWEVFIREV